MKTQIFPIGVLLAITATLESDPATGQVKKKKPVNEYVGAKACKKCHGDIYNSWKKTNMAKSFDVLKAGVRAEEKKKAGLDPNKDYTRDKECLPCHVTGWGLPGGYMIPPKGDSKAAKKAQKKAKAMRGVQCESCHGPGSLVSAYKKKNDEYKWKDLEEKGLLNGVLFPSKDLCVKCHNKESPFVSDKKDYVFDFEKRKTEGTHKHYKMDFGHGCPHEHTVTKKKK